MPELILRPAADLNNNDNMQYSSGNVGYLLINEETADDDATYVYGAYDSTTFSRRSQRFSTQPIQLNKRIKVTSVKTYVRCKTTKSKSEDIAQYRVVVNLRTSGDVGYSVNNEDVDVTTSWKTYTYTFAPTDFNVGTNKDDIIFERGYYSTFGYLSVSLWGKKKVDKNDNFQTRVTQLYAVLTYEELSEPEPSSGIYLKQNAAYSQAKAIWKKTNGIWSKTDKTAIDTTKNYRLIH